jgi:hypothetical protein
VPEQRAHDVLIDPHRRAVYDTCGARALELAGWELVPQLYNPHEVREEYERLRHARERQLRMENAHPQGTFSVEVDATELFRPRSPQPSDDDSDENDAELMEMPADDVVECFSSSAFCLFSWSVFFL